MNLRLRSSAWATALVLTVVSGCRQWLGAQSAPSLQSVLDSAVAVGMPGLQAYVRRGSEEWFGAAGVASVESKRLMTLHDRIRLASVTKMMTYAAVMEIAKRGKLSLSDRAIRFVPARTLDGIPFADAITIAHVLDHTSGLHNYNGSGGQDFFAALFGDDDRGTRHWSAGELIAFAKVPTNPPTGRPGASRAYSSTGYALLEMILEHVEGKPYHEVVRALVFQPLGMTSAGVEGDDLDARSIADSYAVRSQVDAARRSPFDARSPVRSDGLVNLSAGLKWYTAWAGAAGAVAANVRDLAAFMNAVTRDKFIVLKDQRREFDASALKRDSHFTWNGGSWGIQSSIIYEPGRDVTVIVLANASNVGVSSNVIATRLLAHARRASPR
jgi:CubicO group peptidase (beta-lactamase class C family)